MQKLILVMLIFVLGCFVNADLTDGLVAYYPFNGNANDETGDNHGTPTNGAMLTTDRFGNPDSAYDFDGVDDYIDCGNNTVNIAGDLTLSCWVYFPSLPTSEQALIGKMGPQRASDNQYVLHVTSNKLIKLRIYDNLLTVTYNNLEAGHWFHIAGTFEDSQNRLTLYAQGQKIGSTSSATVGSFTAGINLTLGATSYDQQNHRRYLRGKIDEVRIYNRSLSAKEISQLHFLIYRNDFDADGSADILWRNNSNGANILWLLDGTAIAQIAATDKQTDPSLEVVGIGDFNADKKSDILWRNSNTGQNYLWLMSSFYCNKMMLTPIPDTNYKAVGVGDFNGDGKSDILWRNSSTGFNVIWLMNGYILTSSLPIPTVPDTSYEVKGIADFNRDGKADILWRNKSNGSNALWLMDGGTLTQSISLPAVANTSFKIVGIGDFNKDDNVDILWRNADFGQLNIWMMNAATVSSYDDVFSFLDLQWQIAGVNHYDSDGKCDILWRNAVSGENLIWLMDGAAVTSTATLPDVGDDQWKIIGNFQTLTRGNGFCSKEMIVSAPAGDMLILPAATIMDMKVVEPFTGK